jgi:hypothetical protein
MLKLSFEFFKNNGVFGYWLKKMLSLRGGDNTKVLRQIAKALEEQRLNTAIQAILDDCELEIQQKQKLIREITTGILDRSLKTENSWETSTY